HRVRMIPARARRSGRELIAGTAMRGNRGRAFFFRAVNFGRNQLTVPVNEFGNICIVQDVYGDWLAFANANQRPGRSSVVTDGTERAVRRELDQGRSDFQREIGRPLWRARI